MAGYGFTKILESGHLDYKASDLVWAITQWEEYILIPLVQIHFKIEQIGKYFLCGV